MIGPNGTPICRVNLPGSTTPDTACVPYNPFGYNPAPSIPTRRTTSWGTMIWTAAYKQEFAEANISGEPRLDLGRPGLRGGGRQLPQGLDQAGRRRRLRRQRLRQREPKSFSGSYSTKEIYGETVIPLLKDVPFFKSRRVQRRGPPHRLLDLGRGDDLEDRPDLGGQRRLPHARRHLAGHPGPERAGALRRLHHA